jgi:hypothetical protein
MHLRTVISFGFKNFQSHMGITSNVTLRGLLRRTARRYPRVWGAVRKGSLLCGMYFVMMSLIPGTSLPLQTSTKLSLLATYNPHYSDLASLLSAGTIHPSHPIPRST